MQVYGKTITPLPENVLAFLADVRAAMERHGIADFDAHSLDYEAYCLGVYVGEQTYAIESVRATEVETWGYRDPTEEEAAALQRQQDERAAYLRTLHKRAQEGNVMADAELQRLRGECDFARAYLHDIEHQLLGAAYQIPPGPVLRP